MADEIRTCAFYTGKGEPFSVPGTIDTREKEGDQFKVTLPELKPYAQGYTFKGWICDSDVLTDSPPSNKLWKSGKVYKQDPQYWPGQVPGNPTKYTLHALWEYNGYTVKYKFNATGQQDLTESVGWRMNGSRPRPKRRTGYEFLGWIGCDTDIVSSRELDAVWRRESPVKRYQDAQSGWQPLPLDGTTPERSADPKSTSLAIDWSPG